MEVESYMRFAFALIFVLGLIIATAAVARHYGLGYARRNKPSRQRRLSIVEVMPVDARRRLVLVERDNVQHLVLIGPNSETVVETGIPGKAPVLGESAFPNHHAKPSAAGQEMVP